MSTRIVSSNNLTYANQFMTFKTLDMNIEISCKSVKKKMRITWELCRKQINFQLKSVLGYGELIDS